MGGEEKSGGMKGSKQPWGVARQGPYKGRAPGRGHEHPSSGLAGSGD